ncbi:MAG: hypothetical protein B7Y43_11050 [Sphingomonas sp. 28-62-20]|uniref:endonuclease domain-containing protein n=1 Tax=Sphingomonas sp. 28-62-20 TaxID=1970433 RepID=UPI000BC673A6|nr:MAG: hypothetical protein B7Y43_11050 [Sphingomonas sp. 28-62-20]
MRTYASQPIGTVPRARELRRSASPIEKRLLRGLRASFPALKWRHQVPIGPFYADILCFSERLVIEVDGAEHALAATPDARRTAFIEHEGYRVIRFWNNEVMQNLEGVLAQISLSFQEREGARRASDGKGEDSQKAIGSASAEVPLPSPSHASHGPLPLPMGEGK